MLRPYSYSLCKGARITPLRLWEGVVYDVLPGHGCAQPFRGTYTGIAELAMAGSGKPRYSLIFIRFPQGDHVEVAEDALFYTFPYPREPNGRRVIDGAPLNDDEMERFTEAMLSFGALK